MVKKIILIIVCLVAQQAAAMNPVNEAAQEAVATNPVTRTLLPLNRNTLNPNSGGDYKNARFIGVQEDAAARQAIQKANLERLEKELANVKRASQTELRPQPSKTLLPANNNPARSTIPTQATNKPSIWNRLNPFKKFSNRPTIIRNS